MQTHKHSASVTSTEMYWELSQGPGRATQGSHVSKNPQNGAKQRVEPGPDTVCRPDWTPRYLPKLLPQCKNIQMEKYVLRVQWPGNTLTCTTQTGTH